MAYANKYKITVATKSNTISYVYLLEDGYTGSLIEYPADSLQIQYLPQSDDIFEPIIVSQLNLTIDVTDDLTNMPNLTTLNDRKYLVKVYTGENLEWQGWTLSDNVQFNFSTGRKTIAFNAIDGLGLLKNAYYPLPVDYTLNQRVSCLDYIQTCLDLINFPTNLNLISGVSYYAISMYDREDANYYEPLNQSYLKLHNFVDQKNVSTTTSDVKVTSYCLDILTDIVKGFGCRLFQAEGKWFIVAINEFAQSSFYYTEYDSTNTVISSGTRSFLGEIQGYTGNTSGLYFTDNSQMKLFRKGYNKIRFNKSISYSDNYITNFDLKKYTGNNASAWTEYTYGVGGSYTLKNFPTGALNAYILQLGTHLTYLSPDNVPSLSQSDSATFSFDCVAIGGAADPIAIVYVKIILTTDAYTYYLGNDEQWHLEYTKVYKGRWNASNNSPALVNGTGTTGDTYIVTVAGVHSFGTSTFNFEVGDLVSYSGGAWQQNKGYAFVPYSTSNPSNNASFNLPAAPYSGTLSIQVGLGQGQAPIPLIADPYYTQVAAQVQNFRFNFNPNYTAILTESYVVDSEEYVYNADFNMGYNNAKAGFDSYLGFLCDSAGYTLGSWYRYEYPTNIYTSLNELIIKQYSNALNKNLINIDSTFMGMQPTAGRFSMGMRITATDTDPTQINVSSKKYILGNSTLDLFNNTIQSTLLDINDENITTTLATRYFTNTLSPIITGYGHLRSTAYSTREAAAAAPLTTFLVYNNTTGAPSVGDRYYTDELLITGFNGANLWWRIMNDDIISHTYKISGAGYILEIYA
jgi:hypothetical protein